VPDIIACFNGIFLGLEVKNESGKMTELQKWNIDAIGNAGGISACVRDVEEVKIIVEKLGATNDRQRG
jgi:hypothetical protein